MEGDLGRMARRWAGRIMVAVVLLGLAWPVPTEWLFRSLLNFDTHELMEWLQPVFRGLVHIPPAHLARPHFVNR